MSLSFSPIFYSGVFIIALLVFVALYCLTSKPWSKRFLYATILALLTLSHQVLLDIGANYDVSIFPIVFFLTTFCTNIMVLSIPLALVIGIVLGLRCCYRKLWSHLLPRLHFYVYQQHRKKLKRERERLAPQTLSVKDSRELASSKSLPQYDVTNVTVNNQEQGKGAALGSEAGSGDSAAPSAGGDSGTVGQGRANRWLGNLLERYLEKHYHIPLDSIPLPLPTNAAQLQAFNHKKGLPLWADGDDYTIVRNVRLADMRKRSGAISWSSGDGDQLIFTDSSGQRTVVDTSVYNRIDYRDKYRHPQSQYLASDGLLGWDEDVIKNNEPLMEDEDDILIEQEAKRIYAANHHGRSMQSDIEAATLAALDLAAQDGTTPNRAREVLAAGAAGLGAGASAGISATGSSGGDGSAGGGKGERAHRVSLPSVTDEHVVPHRRLKLRFLTLFYSCCTLCFILILILSGYSTFNVLSQPTVKSEVIALDVDPQFDGLTIVQLSDLFIGSYYTQQNLTNIVRKATQLRPDIIVITGEISTSPPNLALQRLYPLFRLSAPLGVYIVVGEDISNYVYNKFLDVYKSEHFLFLTNKWVDVPVGKRTMHIMGVANHSARDDNLLSPDNIEITSALCNPNFKEADFSLLLANSAAYAREYHELAEQKINLILTGNTIGNIAHFLGDLIGWKHTDTYYPDLYRISDTMEMYVSSGTNMWPRLPIRLRDSSEITLLLIHSTRLNHEPMLPTMVH